MEARIEKLRKILIAQDLDAALISSVPNIYYLTGYGGFSSEERDAYIFITAENAYLLTNALYIHAVRDQVKHFEVIEQSRTNELDKLLEKLASKNNVKFCGFEDTNLTVEEYTTIESEHISFEPIDLDTLRWAKDEAEIQAIQNACAVGDKAFTYILTQLKEGVSEREIAQALDIFIKQSGYDISFRSIVAFGKNAAVPHHFSSKDTLQKNACVLLDFGVQYEKYCSDMTRTVFFGEANNEYKHVYNTVLEAQQKAIEMLESRLKQSDPQSILMKDIDVVARDFIIDQGFPSIPHTLGHGIGLEVHEGFRLYKTAEEYFENGMVFSIEPGIYLPNNLGVRIEDLFTIQDHKLIKLTHSKNTLLTI